jgi:hypothetical protein
MVEATAAWANWPSPSSLSVVTTVVSDMKTG